MKKITLMGMREAAGVSQLEMANRLKVDQSVVSRKENRHSRRLLLGSLEEYAAALGAKLEIRVKVGKETHAFSLD